MNELPARPEFERTVQRFEAWWQGELVDRPPVTLAVRASRPYGGPLSGHATLRERWLDVEFVVDAGIAALAQRDHAGDAFPCFCPNIGPEITATLFGCELEFGEDTSWSKPVVHDAADWARIAALAPDFENVYWQAAERMTALAIEKCAGRYLVGITDLHGNYDILAGLRDPMQLCLDVHDCPEVLARAGRNVSRGYVEAYRRAYAQVAAAGFGSTCWLATYHRGPSYVPSSDFWCMVSPAIARDLILPDILVEMEPLARSIFHLDGPQALPHLDLLLGLPHLHAVQWVYGAGAGPVTRWVDVYRRVLAAGKSVHVICERADEALQMLQALGPRGIWLQVYEQFPTVADAEAFLREVDRLTSDSARTSPRRGRP